MKPMRRFVTWLLAACFVLMGTGSLQAMHRWQHEIEHGAADTSGTHDSKAPHHGDDESTCALCAQMHDPLATPAIAPLILSLTQAMNLSAQTPTQDRAVPSAYRIDCRGPPISPVVLD